MPASILLVINKSDFFLDSPKRRRRLQNRNPVSVTLTFLADAHFCLACFGFRFWVLLPAVTSTQHQQDAPYQGRQEGWDEFHNVLSRFEVVSKFEVISRFKVVSRFKVLSKFEVNQATLTQEVASIDR